MTTLIIRRAQTEIRDEDAHNPTPRFHVMAGGELVGYVDTWLHTSDWLGMKLDYEKRTEPDKRGPKDIELAMLQAGYERARAVAAELAEDETRRIVLEYSEVERYLKASPRKQCTYQLRRDKDLFCRIPISPEPIASALVGTPVQPTTETICSKGCELPDERNICRHLTHPRIGIQISTRSAVTLSLGPALCAAGHNEKVQLRRCQVTDNDCWEGKVELSSYGDMTAGPTAIHEAIEFLGLVWKQKHALPLYGYIAPTVLGSLALPVATIDDLRSRLLDLADLLKTLRIDDSVLPPGTNPVPKPDETFKRLALMVPSGPEAEKVFRTLSAANSFRNALSHAHARDRGPGLASTLGVEWPVREAGTTWARICGSVAAALADLRRLL